MGFKVVKTEGGKTDWQLYRRILYTALVVWVIAVRIFQVDPFLLSKLLPFAWMMDVLFIVTLWIIAWHLWPYRPQARSS